MHPGGPRLDESRLDPPYNYHDPTEIKPLGSAASKTDSPLVDPQDHGRRSREEIGTRNTRNTRKKRGWQSISVGLASMNRGSTHPTTTTIPPRSSRLGLRRVQNRFATRRSSRPWKKIERRDWNTKYTKYTKKHPGGPRLDESRLDPPYNYDHPAEIKPLGSAARPRPGDDGPAARCQATERMAGLDLADPALAGDTMSFDASCGPFEDRIGHESVHGSRGAFL